VRLHQPQVAVAIVAAVVVNKPSGKVGTRKELFMIISWRTQCIGPLASHSLQPPFTLRPLSNPQHGSGVSLRRQDGRSVNIPALRTNYSSKKCVEACMIP